jgi:hypothetical protein
MRNHRECNKGSRTPGRGQKEEQEQSRWGGGGDKIIRAEKCEERYREEGYEKSKMSGRRVPKGK